MISFFMVIASIFMRLLPHIPNVTPVTATALFGGAYMKKRFAIAIPLISMMISDYLLLYVNPFGYPVIHTNHIYPISAMIHSTTLYVWGSFSISGFIGIWLRKRNKPGNVIFASFMASVQFFLITNFGVWAGGMYTRNLTGLGESYIMGFPFFRWTVIGDLFYTIVFFGTYILARDIVKNVKLSIVTTV